jgi:hypothetical protein
MFFYLDTSAINSLFDSPNLGRISARISKRDVVYPSVFNVAEIGATSDKARRFGLLKLTKQLSGDYRPLAMPADLLKRALASVRVRAKDMDHSMGPEWEGVWIALSDPSRIDDAAYKEIVEWKRKQEEWFQEMHDNGRPKMQSYINRLSEPDRHSLTSRFSRHVKAYSPEGEFVKGLVFDLATRSGANIEIDSVLVDEIIGHSEHWRFFLTSMAYGLFARGVRQTNFSKKQNPGSIDTQQAVYLAACDIFVTADNEQRRMLRLLAPFGHKKRAVWAFDEFEGFAMKR